MSFENEKFKNSKPELPTGETQKLNKAFQENLLLFSKVKNKVAFVNDEVMTPLKLEEGKPSPLGLFVEASLSEKTRKEIPPSGEQRLEVWPVHQRSALLGRLIFEDKEGRLYRDIDLKGIGHIRKREIRKPGKMLFSGAGREGLLDSDTAFFDCQLSEEFLRAGIRTHRVLAIIDLEELIVDGEKISLEEAGQGGIIDEEFQPVIEVRAFSTKARIENLSNFQLQEVLKNDARKLVSQELGRGNKPLSDEEYLEWFAKTLGQNVGLMHKNGWYHNYLTEHNITLDCRIVDLDSITELSNEDDRTDDIENAENSLGMLVEEMGFTKQQFDFFKDLFKKSYDDVFPSEEREKYFVRKAAEKT